MKYILTLRLNAFQYFKAVEIQINLNIQIVILIDNQIAFKFKI